MQSSPRPPKLKLLQDSLYRVLTDSRGARAAARAQPAVVSWISDAPPIDRETRLSVYGDAYFLRLLEALTSDHLAVRRTLGERDFRTLAAEYFARHPPASPSLANLGEHFPAFIAAHRLSGRWPFLSDLAYLERAALTALLTDRLAALDPATLTGLTPDAWGRSRLVFDPTLQLQAPGWPVERLWRAREEPLDARNRSLRRPRVQRLIIWRDEVWVRVREVSSAEATLLKRALDGVRMAELLARQDASTRPKEVRQWFALWVKDGLVKQVVAPGTSIQA